MKDKVIWSSGNSSKYSKPVRITTRNLDFRVEVYDRNFLPLWKHWHTDTIVLGIDDIFPAIFDSLKEAELYINKHYST